MSGAQDALADPMTTAGKRHRHPRAGPAAAPELEAVEDAILVRLGLPGPGRLGGLPGDQNDWDGANEAELLLPLDERLD